MLAFHRAGAYPLPQGGSWIDEAVRGDCRAPRRPCATRRRPQDVASDGETRRQWTLAGLTLKNAKAVVDQDLAPALGVTIGFNALDGD